VQQIMTITANGGQVARIVYLVGHLSVPASHLLWQDMVYVVSKPPAGLAQATRALFNDCYGGFIH
jgi:hypothetical protein